MYKIPSDTKTYSIAKSSDLSGNIHYTKNVNLDETGYIKVSSPVFQLESEKNDADFGLPISFGRTDIANFLVATDDQPWIMNVDKDLGKTSTQDTDSGHQNLSIYSWGRWWQNRWYVSTVLGGADIYYKSGSTWTSTGVSLTSNVPHPLEVFRNKLSLCAGNGNQVELISTAHSITETLVLPSDYEVTGLAYSNNRMGVITKLSNTASSQNQEAYFFVWDGSTSQANGGFPMGTDMCIAISAYKSSWIILTRTGEIQYFNGGGFETIATLPYAYRSLLIGDSVNRPMIGDILQVDGDLIYLNVSNDINFLNVKQEKYIEEFPAGVLCYDPAVGGFYHRYAPSNSSLFSASALQANINTSTDTITLSTSVSPATGSRVCQTYQDALGGITIGKWYYVINVSSTAFKFAETLADALAGTAVDITSTGNATSYFSFVTVTDYGISYIPQSVGGIAQVSKSEKLFDHLVFGGNYLDYASSTDYSAMCMTVPNLPNVGYFVTSKIPYANIEDNAVKVYVKYRPLDTDDTIVVKYKERDIIGIPTTTPQKSSTTAWTSSTTFTTTADISEAYTYLNDEDGELECEIIAGAGAGQMSQISSITLNAGIYTVTLEDSIEGAANTYYLEAKIDNWKKLGYITTSDSNGYKEFPIGVNSKWIKFKGILKGVLTTFEEMSFVNSTHLKPQ